MTDEQWQAGDVVLDAGGGLWTRAADTDVAKGWSWAYTYGYAPGGAKQLPTQEGAVEETCPARPLTLILRDGQPVVQDLALARTIDVLKLHEWNARTDSCRCGWTQRASLPRGSAQINHAHHVAEQLVRSA